MEYGLVVFHNTDNIGDDIQSYAAMQFLPRVDHVIDREQLDLFSPPSGGYVAAIMNGWYMHDKFSWPPSSHLVPLYLSMHFTRYDHLGIGEKYLEGLGGDYLRRYAPIGCRDDATVQLLQEKGIETWFSGCVTLTLPKQPVKKPERPYLCICDLNKEQAEHARNLAAAAGLDVVETAHRVDYYTHPMDWSERVTALKALLGTYQNAACVITSRLHCALPCLAMEVPVLLLYDEQHSDTLRLGTYAKLTNSMSGEQFCTGQKVYDVACPPANPAAYRAIRQDLTERCSTFIEQVSAPGYCPAQDKAEFEAGWRTRVRWQKQLLGSSMDDFRTRENEYRGYIDQLQQGNAWLDKQYKDALTQLEQEKAYQAELKNGKDWLEAHYNGALEQLEREKSYRAELEQSKDWLETQWKAATAQLEAAHGANNDAHE